MNIPEKKIGQGGRYYEYVIENIKEMISSGELKCGDKIPSERELAEKFNVSRVPIREALKILEYMGILDSSQGDGTYVRSITTEDIISKMGFAVNATAGAIADLLEVRINLETFAAYHAAHRRTSEDIHELQQLMLEMREAKKKPGIQSEEDIHRQRRLSYQFHAAMVRAAHNSILTSIYENLFELLEISRQFTINESGISYNSILAHEAILNQIIQRDGESARESVAGHLADLKAKLDAGLSRAKMEKIRNKDDQVLDGEELHTSVPEL